MPATIEPQIVEWQARYSDLLNIYYQTQYTGHKIYALTVTDKNVPDANKKKLLTTVSHGHEPAGTAAIMNYINQLLTGKHLKGRPVLLKFHLRNAKLYSFQIQ